MASRSDKIWMKSELVCLSPSTIESTIMLRESSQGESSVMRLRLEGHKKPITNMHYKSEYILVGSEYALAGSKYAS